MDDKDKDIEETAIRETNEEIQVNPTSLKQVAVLNFFHLGKTDNNQQVTVYTHITQVCNFCEGIT